MRGRAGHVRSGKESEKESEEVLGTEEDDVDKDTTNE